MYYVFFHATATPESYTHCPTLSLPDALPIYLRDDPPVLVVAPLSGHHATLLRDTVRTLLRDHKVYVTDWVDARMVPGEEGTFSLDDYVRYIEEFIRHIGAKNLHVMSVCQPTVDRKSTRLNSSH